MIILLLADGSEEIEAVTILDVLRRGKINIMGMSITPSLDITGSRFVGIKADTLWDDSLVQDADMLILPGGAKGMEALRADSRVIAAVQNAHANGRYVAAICAGPLVLERAGILKRKRATCYPSFQAQLTDAILSQDRVVIDGNIITSQGPGTAMDFALALLRILAGDAVASDVAKGLLI